MTYKDIIQDERCVRWSSYRPLDTDYLKYAATEPSVIAAAFKIEDVSYAMSDARASMIYANEENFGDLSSGDELSNRFVKSYFLTNAIKSYAITLDMSWQVVWAYIQPASLEYLFENKYKKMEKECDRDNLLAQLDCAIQQKAPGFTKAITLKKIVTDFDNDPDVQKFRTLYNRIKHQGTIHFKGLGLNEETMMISVNGYEPTMLHRDSFSFDQIEEMVVEYHFKFVKYMEDIISVVIPKDYLNKKMSFGEAIEAIQEIQRKMNE